MYECYQIAAIPETAVGIESVCFRKRHYAVVHGSKKSLAVETALSLLGTDHGVQCAQLTLNTSILGLFLCTRLRP